MTGGCLRPPPRGFYPICRPLGRTISGLRMWSTRPVSEQAADDAAINYSLCCCSSTGIYTYLSSNTCVTAKSKYSRYSSIFKFYITISQPRRSSSARPMSEKPTQDDAINYRVWRHSTIFSSWGRHELCLQWLLLQPKLNKYSYYGYLEKSHLACPDTDLLLNCNLTYRK